MRILTILTAGLLAAGCSLPGHRLQADDGGGGWFGADSRYAEAEPRVEPQRDYDAKVYPITPALIRSLNAREQEQERRTGPRVIDPRPGDRYPAYRVGPGDVLNVIVYGHPDLTNPMGTSQNVEANARLVDANGNIFFPFVGEIQVEDLTLDQIRKKIAQGLSTVLRDPQIDVQVLRYRSKQIFITGDISRPCSVPVTDIPLTVYQALDQCQGLLEREQFGARALRLVRAGESHALDLGRIYRREEPFWLQAGDRLVIDDRLNRVFLIGEFEEQAMAQIAAGGMTLADAMAEAGGLNLNTADASSIFVIRGFVEETPGPEGELRTNVRPEVYRLNARSAEALILADQFELRPRDVVYAAPAGLVSFNRVLALVAPSLNLLFQTAIIYDRTRD